MTNTDTDGRLTVGLRVNVDEETSADIDRLAELEERPVAAVIRRAIKAAIAAAKTEGRL